MTIQDQSDIPHSSTRLAGGNRKAGEQIQTGEGYVPKIRKPYTIIKEREKWTEEEHDKFLEALKMYGRAWRKIEGHVGTKTAVQIRSHAQKFFSKVVRESNSTNSCSTKPIEIPPPRPKRKPTHPYPRRLVSPAKKEMPLQELSARSMSLNSSVDQENLSPSSVLSAVASDTLGSADSNTSNDISLHMSSQDYVNHAAYFVSEDDLPEEENVSQYDDPDPMKLELFPRVDARGKECSVDVTSTKSIKLFGKTLTLADPEKSSTSSPCSIKPTSLDIGKGLAPELADSAAANAESSPSQLSPAMLPAIRYMNASSHPMEVVTSAPLPCWACYRGTPFSFLPLNNVNFTIVEETQKEGSSSGSNT